MPVVECDPVAARRRLEEAGIDIEPGNTDHERWRASHAGGTAVAYEDKVVVQGSTPDRLTALVRPTTGGRAYVYFDGAARGNPGPAAIGWVIVTADGVVAEGGERIGETTNNRAEYEALIRGLEVATARGFDTVELRGDSELIIKQVTGEYDVKNPELRERRVRVHELLGEFDEWSIAHLPREANERADALASEALEGS
ncbi:MAG: ribonuclease HI [Salinirussus sp.]